MGCDDVWWRDHPLCGTSQRNHRPFNRLTMAPWAAPVTVFGSKVMAVLEIFESAELGKGGLEFGHNGDWVGQHRRPCVGEMIHVSWFAASYGAGG
jgi:hypothetical protein